MRSYADPMKMGILLAMAVLLTSVAFSADPTPVEAKTRESKEFHPQLNIRNIDRYVDYTREGKVVFRTIERTVVETDLKGGPVASGVQHIIEFVADGKVFADVWLDGPNALNWDVVTNIAVEYKSGYAGVAETERRRFINICLPSADYFEYLEVNGINIRPGTLSPDAYQRFKNAEMERMKSGYLHELDKP